MQTITSIAADETLVASGNYAYFLNDQPTGVTEPWCIHHLSDGSYCTRVERDARAAFGTTILVEAHSQTPFASDSLQRFVVQQYNERNAATADVRAEYIFNSQAVTVTRTINGHAVADETIALPDNTVVSPLMRVFLGPVILQVWQRGGGQPVPVLVPSLEQILNPAMLLRPLFDARQAALLGTEEIELAGQSIVARRFQYLSNHYDTDSQFWLDEHGVLLRYFFPQSPTQSWDTRLVNYQRLA
jgi:hypothetical protein